MAIDNPVSMPAEDDVRSALEAAWDETPAEEAPAPEAKAPAAEAAAETPETAEAASQRARDEQGRFAKKEAAEAVSAKPEAPVVKPGEQAPEAAAAAQAGPAGPPPGWSVAAKAEFDKLPQSVKEAIVSRETEINKGFAKLTEYKGLDPYVDMARQAGSNLPQVLDRYMNAEKLLATDFVNGVRSLCQMYNVHPAGLAQHLVGQGQPGNQQPRQPNPLDPVLQEVSALKAELANIRQGQEMSAQEAVSGQIAGFANDPAHKYFENVRQSMGHLLASGQAQDMAAAYEMACWMNPEIRALQIKEATAPAQAQRMQAVTQARAASKSIPIGSPIPGAQANGKGEPQSLRADLEAHWDALSGAI